MLNNELKIIYSTIQSATNSFVLYLNSLIENKSIDKQALKKCFDNILKHDSRVRSSILNAVENTYIKDKTKYKIVDHSSGIMSSLNLYIIMLFILSGDEKEASKRIKGSSMTIEEMKDNVKDLPIEKIYIALINKLLELQNI